MSETGVAVDTATVEVLQDAVVSEMDGEPTGETEGPGETDYVMLAQRCVQLMQRVVQSGDQIAVILVNPAHIEGFKQGFQELPNEILAEDPEVAQQIKDELPVEPDENVTLLQLVTGGDIEKRFLETYFGPAEYGGNNLIPRMQQALANRQAPVRISIDWLRARFLDEVAQSAVPQVVRADSGLVLPGRMR